MNVLTARKTLSSKCR